MQFKNEKQLQLFIHSALTAAGICAGNKDSELEQYTNDKSGRVDILSAQYAIEVKPKLSRGALMQAYGQLGTYKDSFPDRQLVIAGLPPTGERARKSAIQAADRIAAQGVSIWWVSEMEVFTTYYDNLCEAVNQPEEEESFDNDNEIYWPAVILAVLIGCFGIAITLPRSKTPSPGRVTPARVFVHTAARVTPPQGFDLIARDKDRLDVGRIANGSSVIVTGPPNMDGYTPIKHNRQQYWVFDAYLTYINQE